jgi:hypothetical protein
MYTVLSVLSGALWGVVCLMMEAGLSIWRVAANVLNKQSQTHDKGCSSSLFLGEVLTSLHRSSLP